MRTSRKRTTAAVLRAILGIKVADMAEFLECSVHTIQSLETGRLPISQEMATRMLIQTEISPEWLLAGKPDAQPLSVYDTPYTKEHFNRVQAEITYRKRSNDGGEWLLSEALDLSARLVAIFASASKRHKYVNALYKARIAIKHLSDEFGQDLALYTPQDFGDFNMRQAMAIAEQLSEKTGDGRGSTLNYLPAYEDAWKVKRPKPT